MDSTQWVCFHSSKAAQYKYVIVYAQLKMEMLELVENHYLKLGLEIVPTLPALVPSVLLMIEENDEVIRLKTISVIDSLVGVGEFDSDCGQ